MSNTFKIRLADLPAPPPSGSIQFFDGYFPALGPDTYNISVRHDVTAPSGPSPSYEVDQSFVVQAPEFFVDTTIIQTVYPPPGGADVYGQQLPFLVMADPSLPWERSLVPGQDQPSPINPTPWMALVIFAEGEIYLQPNSNNPVATVSVSHLLNPDPNVLKPQFPVGWVVDQDVLASQCQTITIKGSAFNAVLPSTTDLSYLAHCRAVNTLDEGEALLSVLLSNRLPVTPDPKTPLRYFAHLVSLEGFAEFLGPNAKPIPTRPNSSELMDVQLVSLFNWTFVSQPQSGLGFEELVNGLIQSELAQLGALSLPVPPNSNLPQAVESRLQDGYVALDFISGSGDESFAWYRGPFAAKVPQPLPAVGNPPTPVSQVTNADALMIYLAEQGLFDLSYATAWNIGRSLALADASFAQKVSQLRLNVNNALAMLSQRMAMPLHAGETDIASLLARDASRRRFAGMMGAGLGRRWTAALDGPHQSNAPVSRQIQQRRVLHPREVLQRPGVAAAISESFMDPMTPVAAWLANLSLLYPVPFSYLVPDQRMLPVESIRFFYLDQNWIEALTAGALSIAIHSSSDVAIHAALLPQLNKVVAQQRRALIQTRPDALIGAGANGVNTSGMLIRSQLVSGWPKLVITATLDGAPVNIIRNDCLADNVRLCLFDGIPDTVTLAEPYQGLLFGIEDLEIVPRCVTSAACAGAPIANTSPLTPTFRSPATGVLEVTSTAAALETAVGAIPFATDAVVRWNETPLQTTFLSPTQLTAIVPASLIATAGTAAITVLSGGATSFPANFMIDGPGSSRADSTNTATDPAIESLQPSAVKAGGSQLTLVVDGVNFAAGATVRWNGKDLVTTGDAKQLTATVPLELLATPAIVSIGVFSGNVLSNTVPFTVVGPQPAIGLLEPSSAIAGSPQFILTVTGGFGAGDFALQMVAAPEFQSFSVERNL